MLSELTRSFLKKGNYLEDCNEMRPTSHWYYVKEGMHVCRGSIIVLELLFMISMKGILRDLGI